ncbi:MAG: ferritin [Alphaproteobacteria bacterium]
MLTEKLFKLMEKQVAIEEQSARIYLQMSLVCAEQDLTGGENFFKGHSDEEYQHMQKFIRYLIDRNQPPKLDSLEAPKVSWVDLPTMVEDALKHEKFVTSSILKLRKLADESNDPATTNFLDTFIDEQNEEEALFSRLIRRLKLTGNDSRSIWYQDQEMQRMHGLSHGK